jgi:hypothetical protein
MRSARLPGLIPPPAEAGALLGAGCGSAGWAKLLVAAAGAALLACSTAR